MHGKGAVATCNTFQSPEQVHTQIRRSITSLEPSAPTSALRGGMTVQSWMDPRKSWPRCAGLRPLRQVQSVIKSGLLLLFGGMELLEGWMLLDMVGERVGGTA